MSSVYAVEVEIGITVKIRVKWKISVGKLEFCRVVLTYFLKRQQNNMYRFKYLTNYVTCPTALHYFPLLYIFTQFVRLNINDAQSQ